jgi:hypothetical protein
MSIHGVRLTCQPEHQRTLESDWHVDPSSISIPGKRNTRRTVRAQSYVDFVRIPLSAPPVLAVTHDHMITPSFPQHVGDQLGGDRGPRLVLLILPGIREMRYDGGDSSGRSDLASVDHDTEFEQRSIDHSRSLTRWSVPDRST